MYQESLFWISPEGEFFRVREGTHEEWAAENICPQNVPEFQTSYPAWETEDSGDSENYRGAIFKAAWDAGWTDAHFEPTVRILYLRNPAGATLPSRPVLEDIATRNGWALATDWWETNSIPFFDARPPNQNPPFNTNNGHNILNRPGPTF